MINVMIDNLTPCLKDSTTGEIVQTEVIRIKRSSFLRKYNKRNGWYVNWSDILKTAEVYALVVEGSVDIQGLVALSPDDVTKSVFIGWMCASPENNKLIVDNPKYLGVGGHLFSIAIQKSIDYGFEGAVYGNAANMDLLKHYIKCFNATFIGMRHPYQFMIDEKYAKNILEVYDYDWTDEQI